MRVFIWRIEGYRPSKMPIIYFCCAALFAPYMCSGRSSIYSHNFLH